MKRALLLLSAASACALVSPVSSAGSAARPSEGPPRPQARGHAPATARLRPAARLEPTTHLKPTTRLESTARIDAVDPMIGSGGLGYGVGSMVPGPTLPFGMLKVSPDTTWNDLAPGFAHCAGYWYVDPEIMGFSHNHLVGTGVPDQGNIRVMPLVGIDNSRTQPEGYRSSFSHDTEEAAAGYYAVTLDNGGIRVELTATEHAAVHRFTFPSTNLAAILIDASAVLDGGSASDVAVEVDPGTLEVTGRMTNHNSLSGRYGGQPIFFSAQLRATPDEYGVFAAGDLYPDQTTASGDGAGAYFQLTTSAAKPIEMAVGISYVSVDQARLNRQVETDGLSFDQVRDAAEAAWEEVLSVADLEGGTDVDRRIFYTALYHTMMMPTVYTDVNGKYVGFDKQVHTAQGFTYYTDMSMWDTFRTLHPLMSLIDPERAGDFNTSMLSMYDQSGYIDRWPQGNGATGCMVGDPQVLVIADSYLRGVRNFDVDKAYETVRAMTTLEGGGGKRDHLDWWLNLGYIPVESGGSSASKTLEYADADAAMAWFAAALGETEDAAMYAERGTYYRNIWNPDEKFLMGRSQDGNFVTPFLPHAWGEYYAEGNAWQWTMYVPHDGEGLADLFGGARSFERTLDGFFARSARATDTLLPDNNYWHGNEPDILASYLYHYAGRPSKSQKWARWVAADKYRDTPDGLDGNDDGGTLSAWYVFTAMGFFAVPGQDVYLIGSPIFTRSTLHLAGGDFVISAPAASATNLYVQSATLNGKPWNQSWFRHSDLAAGGTLELVMGPSPSTWAETGPLPPSISTTVF